MTRPLHDPHRCHYCGVSDERQELNPLGPARASVCLSCVTDPRHPEQAPTHTAARPVRRLPHLRMRRV